MDSHSLTQPQDQTSPQAGSASTFLHCICLPFCHLFIFFLNHYLTSWIALSLFDSCFKDNTALLQLQSGCCILWMVYQEQSVLQSEGRRLNSSFLLQHVDVPLGKVLNLKLAAEHSFRVWMGACGSSIKCWLVWLEKRYTSSVHLPFGNCNKLSHKTTWIKFNPN